MVIWGGHILARVGRRRSQGQTKCTCHRSRVHRRFGLLRRCRAIRGCRCRLCRGPRWRLRQDRNHGKRRRQLSRGSHGRGCINRLCRDLLGSESLPLEPLRLLLGSELSSESLLLEPVCLQASCFSPELSLKALPLEPLLLQAGRFSCAELGGESIPLEPLRLKAGRFIGRKSLSLEPLCLQPCLPLRLLCRPLLSSESCLLGSESLLFEPLRLQAGGFGRGSRGSRGSKPLRFQAGGFGRGSRGSLGSKPLRFQAGGFGRGSRGSFGSKPLRFQAGGFGRGSLGSKPLCLQACFFCRGRFCREALPLPLEPLRL